MNEKNEGKMKKNIGDWIILMFMFTIGLILIVGGALLLRGEIENIGGYYVPQYVQDRWQECEKVEDLDLQRDCKEYYNIKSWLTKEEYFKSREQQSASAIVGLADLTLIFLGLVLIIFAFGVAFGLNNGST